MARIVASLRVWLSALVVVLFVLLAALRAQAPPAGLSNLDSFVARAMQAFDVPGVAVSIVKEGALVFAKGYGVRRLGEPARVDEQTLFGIASNTKAFTAMALGLLVEEGRIAWDGPVVRYLPWFQMWDPYVTRELTVRDLLVHRSGLGLGAGDLLWWPPSTYDRKEIARRLRFIRPATSFRTAYAYDNVLYLVAGELIEAVSGQTWEQFVAERILKNVGMARTTVRHAEAVAGANVASPHAPIDGVVRPISAFVSDNTNPAGGINSNAEDMGKWMAVLLNEGSLTGGARLFGESTAREMMTMVTPMRIAQPAPELESQRMNFLGYALGFLVHDYRGRKVVMHTGGLPGYVSRVTMVPDLELGVAVLTNQESGEAFDSITYQILDEYLGAPQTDWVGAYLKVQARRRAGLDDTVKRTAAAREASSRPSLPLARYVGTYNDEWYGDVEILDGKEALIMRFTRTPSLVGDLEHWQYDTFVVKWRDRELRADAYVTFSLEPDGTIGQMKMRAVSPATDFSFDFHDLLLKPATPMRP